jgi:uncharacterized membrane protein (UPF0127 family)
MRIYNLIKSAIFKTNHYQMEKSMQNKTASPVKRQGVSGVTVLLMGTIVVLSLTMANCQSKKTATQATNNDLTTEVKFKKDGELKFLDGKTDKLISKIDIEAALTPDQEQQGLMFRRSMADSLGMLFVFDTEEQQSFWMKNTYISLDIIYVNAKKEIVSIAANCKPLSEESIPSEGNAKYVVEVNGGYAAKQGLKKGDKIDYTLAK